MEKDDELIQTGLLYAQARRVTEHELGHHWNLNRCSDQTSDHTHNFAWCSGWGCQASEGPPVISLMNVDPPTFAEEPHNMFDRFSSAELFSGDVGCGMPQGRSKTLRFSGDPL